MAGSVKDAHRELTAEVMGRKGVTGTAIGRKGGAPCLKVYVTDRSIGSTLPSRVGGYPVVVEATGGFERL